MVICCKFKKNLSDFIHIFSLFNKCIIAADQGLTTKGQNFDVNRKLLSLRSFAISFKKISSKSDFMQFFPYFMHVYSPRAGADNLLGMKF